MSFRDTIKFDASDRTALQDGKGSIELDDFLARRGHCPSAMITYLIQKLFLLFVSAFFHSFQCHKSAFRGRHIDLLRASPFSAIHYPITASKRIGIYVGYLTEWYNFQ